jgi:hypothetical protein
VIEIRYRPPDQVEITGTVQELQAVRAGILYLVTDGTPMLPYMVAARTTGLPAPYAHWLAELMVTVSESAIRASVVGETKLMISGALDKLDVFASFWDFAPDTASGTHSHHEYFEGNHWIERDSIPLVIGVK